MAEEYLGDGSVKVIITHLKSCSNVEWTSESTAEYQKVRDMNVRKADKDGYVYVEFKFYASENGTGYGRDCALLLTLKKTAPGGPVSLVQIQ